MAKWLLAWFLAVAKASSKKRMRIDVRMGIELNTPLGEYLQEYADEGNHGNRLKQLAIMGMTLARIMGLDPATALPLKDSIGVMHSSTDSNSGALHHSENGSIGGAGEERVKHRSTASATDLDAEMPLNFDPSILKITLGKD